MGPFLRAAAPEPASAISRRNPAEGPRRCCGNTRGTEAPRWRRAEANPPPPRAWPRGGRAPRPGANQKAPAGGGPAAHARHPPLVVWRRRMRLAAAGSARRHHDVVRRLHPGRHRRRQAAELGLRRVRLRYGTVRPGAVGEGGAGRWALPAPALTQRLRPRRRRGRGPPPLRQASGLPCRPSGRPGTAPGSGGARVERSCRPGEVPSPARGWAQPARGPVSRRRAFARPRAELAAGSAAPSPAVASPPPPPAEPGFLLCQSESPLPGPARWCGAVEASQPPGLALAGVCRGFTHCSGAAKLVVSCFPSLYPCISPHSGLLL